MFDDSSPYYENIIIGKSIDLIGEDRNLTVIDGSESGDVVIINSDWVNITGFTIQNSGNIDRDAGIEIHSKNNTIKGNNISENDEGIGIWDSSNNTIIKNIISNNDYGLRFFTNSVNNFISDNIINSNKFRGIRLESSDRNIILSNNISKNGNGIRLEGCFGNIISDNFVINNGNGIDLLTSNGTIISDNLFLNDGLRIQDSYKNTVSNNIVNGKPLIYLEGKSNKILDKAGQIILVNCENITIKNQELSNITYGIELWQTNNCIIKDNILYSNDNNGIFLYSSNNNTITDNTIKNNNYGIGLENYGSNNKIINNKILDNEYGIHFYYSGSNTIISDNNISNNIYGVQLFNSHEITIKNNNFSNNYFGASLWYYSSNNEIFLNNFSNCVNGIWLNGANDNNIFENIITENEFSGIWLLLSINNKIIENKIINCQCSIQLYNSMLNIIIDNFFIKGGIVLYYSFDNTVSDNVVNNKPILYLEDSKDVIVEDVGQIILINCENITIHNNELNNLIVGMELWESDYCNIYNNSFHEIYQGSFLFLSNNNTIFYNNISNFADRGLYLFSSNDNIISKNNIFLENDFCKKIIFQKRNTTFSYTSYFNFCDVISKSDNNYADSMDRILKSFIKNTFPIVGNVLLNANIGVTLEECSRNSISENSISNNQDGINLDTSSGNIIMCNKIISNLRYGILLKDQCKNNNIIENTIEKSNGYGIYLEDSYFNKIKKNNFIENNNSALFKDSLLNRWVRNFWNKSRLLPKPIFGKIRVGSISIPWLNFDWRPAKKPN